MSTQELLMVIFAAWALIERILSHNKVSIQQIQALRTAANEATAKTENTLDDKIAGVGFNFMEWLLRATGRVQEDTTTVTSAVPATTTVTTTTTTPLITDEQMGNDLGIAG